MSKKMRWMESYSPEKQKELRRLHLLNARYQSKIIFRYTYKDFYGKESNAAVEFLTIHVFKNYLKDIPHFAEHIKYIEKGRFIKPTARTEIWNVSVCVNWLENDKRLERAFEDVFTFADFLRSNPDLGESLQFPVK